MRWRVADLLTRLDLQKIGEDVVLQRSRRIDPSQVSIQGSDVNIIVGLTAQMAYAVVLQLADRFNSLLLDGAEDEQLDRYAWDRYHITRKGASVAVGTVRFYRVITGTSGTVATGTKLQTLTGVEYITTSVATFSAIASEATATVRATQAGKASQVGTNSIRKISDTMFDPSIMVTNDQATAHGEDAEQDSDFVNRIRNYWSTARRGILSAIEHGAIAVPGVDSAKAVEVTDDSAPARLVQLYIADSSGVASSVLAQTVRDALLEHRAAGIQALVYTSMPQIVEVQLKLAFRAGTDTLAVTETIRNALVEYINSTPTNTTLYRGALQSVLERYVQDGLVATNDSIQAPAGDLVPDVGKTLRTTLSDVIAL